jgi:ATP-dependent DNA helicase RecQ
LPKPAAAAAAHDPALFELLRGKRRELADQAGVPPDIVFSDRTLIEMATRLPRTAEQFLAIDGVGEAKLAAYGEAFLNVIRVYGVTHNVQPAQGPAAPAAEPIGGSTAERRFEAVGEAFAAGATLDDLAARFGVQREAILRSLQRYAEAGHALDANRLLQSSRLPHLERERVFAAFELRGDERLGRIHTAMGGAVDYDELHLLRLVWRLRKRPLA